MDDEPLIDPALLPLVAEQRKINALVTERGRGLRPPGEVPASELRRARLYRADGSLRPTLHPLGRDRRLGGGSGGMLLREFSPPGARGLIAHFHGGGWAMGSVYEQDEVLAGLATAAGARVVSLDYPLSPEHQLPQILEAAAQALDDLLRETAEPVCVAGDSAGAQVALQSILRLRARPDVFARIRAVSLSYGIYDLSMTPSQRAWGSAFAGLSTDWLAWFYALALPGRSREMRRHPALSPLYADLSSLPPLLLSVGELDPLLDDSLFLHQRWRAAGSPARLHVYPQAFHGFNHAPTAMAACCNARIAAFAAAALAPQPPSTPSPGG